MKATATATAATAPTAPLFSVVQDEYGNRTFFPLGEVPETVNGSPVEIISSPVTWEEAHDWL